MAIGVVVELFKAVVGPSAGEILQQVGVLIGQSRRNAGLDLRVCGLGLRAAVWLGPNERKYQGVWTVLAVRKALPQRFNLGKVIVVDLSSPEQIAHINGAALMGTSNAGRAVSIQDRKPAG